METVLITGGTGLIGTMLSKELAERGYDVVILTRKSKGHALHPKISCAQWDVDRGLLDSQVLSKTSYIIHLAGANVADRRWTPERKKEIKDSRVKSGRLLVKALSDYSNEVKAVLSASAIGWYGPDPEIPNPTPFKETDPPASDFLGSTCRLWEEAISPVTDLGKRLVILRTGIVLSSDGGAYPAFRKSLRFGLAAILGSGKQVISWIHISDLVRLYIQAMESEKWKGVYNAVAPQPVSNRHLVSEIAKHGRHPFVSMKVPSFLLKTILGEMSVEVLKSATVSCGKAVSAGFNFTFSSIGTAVHNLEKKSRMKRDR